MEEDEGWRRGGREGESVGGGGTGGEQEEGGGVDS